MKKFIRLFAIMVAAGFVLTACEGPMGKDANESCTQCHNQAVVDSVRLEYVHSKHFEGAELAAEEGTRNACAPCHSHQGFLSVVQNNTPASFAVDPKDPTKYISLYVADSTSVNLPGGFNCFTCHSSLHTSYTMDDFRPLTNEDPVEMTMWGGQKTIDFPKEEGNLCAKCHQPRPVTGSNGNLIDYTALVSAPNAPYTLSGISYRTGVHYGVQGALAAGVGGVEFGSGYTNSAHATEASCASCHMARPSGNAGGHSFEVAGNFNGCNTCHSSMGPDNSTFTATAAEIDGLIADLAQAINAIGAGHDILQRDPLDEQYHGYIDVWDAQANPTGYWKNPEFGSPALNLTNAQFGAIINFQLVARDKSHGVHNAPYIKKLIENTLAAI